MKYNLMKKIGRIAGGVLLAKAFVFGGCAHVQGRWYCEREGNRETCFMYAPSRLSSALQKDSKLTRVYDENENIVRETTEHGFPDGDIDDKKLRYDSQGRLIQIIDDQDADGNIDLIEDISRDSNGNVQYRESLQTLYDKKTKKPWHKIKVKRNSFGRVLEKSRWSSETGWRKVK